MAKPRVEGVVALRLSGYRCRRDIAAMRCVPRIPVAVTASLSVPGQRYFTQR